MQIKELQNRQQRARAWNPPCLLYTSLEDAIAFIPYGCMVDEFQHIVYSNPDLTPDERHAAWKKLEEEYKPHPVSYTHLDDLGVERNSEYALGIIFSVIDRRIRSGRPLIITTNLPLKEIKSETMLEKRRIYDRILEMCTPMYVGGTSKREAIASMKMEKAKTLLNTKNDRAYCG